MNTGRCDSHEDVSDLYFCSINQFRFLDDSRSVARDVIFTVFVHSGHLGSFAAHEGASSLTAAFSYTGYNCLNHLGTCLALGNIVQEYEGFSSLGQHVVDAHRHGVDPYGVVLVHGKGNLQFGSHSVSAAHKDRFLDVKG